MRLATLAAALTATVLFPSASHAAAKVSAGQAEAKEAARAGNCTPGKVKVVKYTIGARGETVFKIDCTESSDTFVLVQCRSRTCALLR
jgi:hypothetical protein